MDHYSDPRLISQDFLHVRPDWLALRQEETLEPELPIVDPHHHLWDRPNDSYLLPDLLADTGSGHNIVATVFVEARVMYRAADPEDMRAHTEGRGVTPDRPQSDNYAPFPAVYVPPFHFDNPGRGE